jgi:hypothetical protein
MNPLKEKTKGGIQPRTSSIRGGTAWGDYKVEGSLTHGKGSPEHPSHGLGTKDSNGKEERYIPHEPVEIPKGDLMPPIPGSSHKLEQPHVKEKLDKGSETRDQS